MFLSSLSRIFVTATFTGLATPVCTDAFMLPDQFGVFLYVLINLTFHKEGTDISCSFKDAKPAFAFYAECFPRGMCQLCFVPSHEFNLAWQT